MDVMADISVADSGGAPALASPLRCRDNAPPASLGRRRARASNGIGKAKVGVVRNMSEAAEKLYQQGKYERALDTCREAREILMETSDFLNVDNDIRSVDENILNCRNQP